MEGDEAHHPVSGDSDLGDVLLRRHPDVVTAPIGSEALVYDPRSARIHRINATGLAAWNCCDGSRSEGAVIAELAQRYGQPVSQISEEVRRLLELLCEAGLLATPSPTGRAAAPKPLSSAATDTSVLDSGPSSAPIRTLGPYVALDARVAIDCHDSESVAAELERVFGSLEVGLGGRDGLGQRLVVWQRPDGWGLATNVGTLIAPDESVLADFVAWQMTRLAIESSPRYMIVHASAVAKNGAAVVLPATANSGKSTLAVLLVAAGFEYLTDEATAIDLDAGEVVAYRKPITLDPGSQALLPLLEHGQVTGQSPKWRVRPDDVRGPQRTQRARLRHLVFPTWDSCGSNELAPLSAIDAVERLTVHTINLSEHGSRLSHIARLVESCTTHELRHHGVKDSLAAITALVDSVARR